MSKFSQDSPVCHPLYGLGTVEIIERKEVLGETISLAQIFFPRENLKMMVNIEKETELFRAPIEEEQVDAVFEHMKNHEGQYPSRANQRQRINLDKIKSNDIFQLTEVIKDLVVMSSKKKLSFKESEMLERARTVLIEELSTVTGRKTETMDELIARACLPSNYVLSVFNQLSETTRRGRFSFSLAGFGRWRPAVAGGDTSCRRHGR